MGRIFTDVELSLLDNIIPAKKRKDKREGEKQKREQLHMMERGGDNKMRYRGNEVSLYTVSSLQTIRYLQVFYKFISVILAT